MKKRKSSAKAHELRPRLRITSGKEIAFGPGKSQLLALVGETGSISQAASRMGMSYMRAWSLVQTMNACFKQPVVTAVRGGQNRGGARLTPIGEQVLKLYCQMEKKCLKATQADWRALQTILR